MSTTVTGEPAPGRVRLSDGKIIEFLQKMAVFGETERFQQLDRYEAFFRSRMYDHQTKDWWGRDADAMETVSPGAAFPDGYQPSGPTELMVRDRRPTAPTNRARTITRRYTSLLFSEKRRPKVHVEQDDDTDAFLEAVREAAKFWHSMRRARNLGGAMGSVVVTVHVRDGQFSYEVHNSKHCTPVWDDHRTHRLAGLLKMYRTSRTENAYDDKNRFVGTQQVDYLYRRIITENFDIVYREVKLDDAISGEAGWEVESIVRHSMGRFPGVWIQNSEEDDDIDGEPDCQGAYQAIDTNDRLVSQMFSSVLANLDPTPVLGFDEKEVEAMGGVGGGGGIAKGSGNALYVGKGGTAQYMEMEGGGVSRGIELSNKLEQSIDDQTGAVFLDDEEMAAAQSARAIEFRFEPMLEVADDLRAQYGPAIRELMQITADIARRFQDAKVTNAEGRPLVYVFDLPMRKRRLTIDGEVKDVMAPHKVGPGGYISIEWGPYFAPTEDDNEKMIRNSASANQAGFVPREDAARRVATIFGITDVRGAVAKAREEKMDDAEASLGFGLGGGFDGGVPPARTEPQVPAAGEGGKP